MNEHGSEQQEELEQEEVTALQLARQREPNLAKATSIDEVHEWMIARSANLTADDATAETAFRELPFVFKGIAPFVVFQPHHRKKDRDKMDRYYLSDYHRCAVEETHLIDALEIAHPTRPSTILYPSRDLGGLYLGGFSAATNLTFLRSHGVRQIINCAKGLDLFPTYKGYRASLAADGIEVLELGWDDSMGQSIDQDIERTMKVIHDARRAGGSVLCHCAAGRSRSASVVVAYICTLQEPQLRELQRSSNEQGDVIARAVRFVQQRRHLAHPNDNFRRQLLNLANDGLFVNLHRNLVAV